MARDNTEITDSLQESAGGLHQLFSTIFPSSTQSKTGARLKGLYFISHQGPVAWNEQKDQLYSAFDISSRQGLRKSLEALEEQKLIIWSDGIIKATAEGHRTIEGLEQFITQYSDEADIDKESTKFERPHYKHATAKVYTNGDEYADYLWTWTLMNLGDEPIENVEYMCESGGSDIGDLDLNYSNNIDTYHITVNKPDTRYFEIEFGEPIEPGESLQYWYSYRLPQNYHPDWGPFRFTYRCRTFPVANLEINIINDNRFEVDGYNLRDTIEIGDRSSVPTSPDQSRPRIERMDGLSYITYSARYIPLGTTVALHWDFSYSP